MNLVKTNSQTAINQFILLFNINSITVKSISQQAFSKAIPGTDNELTKPAPETRKVLPNLGE
jgi:hypothetical protein